MTVVYGKEKISKNLLSEDRVFMCGSIALAPKVFGLGGTSIEIFNSGYGKPKKKIFVPVFSAVSDDIENMRKYLHNVVDNLVDGYKEDNKKEKEL